MKANCIICCTLCNCIYYITAIASFWNPNLHASEAPVLKNELMVILRMREHLPQIYKWVSPNEYDDTKQKYFCFIREPTQSDSFRSSVASQV